MYLSKKIALSFFVTIGLLSTGSLVLYGQDKMRHLHQSRPITIGFDVEKATFETPPILAHKKINWTTANAVSVKAPVNKHISIESGMTFTMIPGQPYIKQTNGKFNMSRFQPYSIPVTMQYYPVPHRCKLHPYCGVGMQYNMHPFTPNLNTAEGQPVNNASRGTKYISILFTQGVTYEINTKIELTQTFHFIPQTTCNPIGFGIGVGYKIR